MNHFKNTGNALLQKRIGIVGFGEMGKRHGHEFREATKGMIEIAGVVEPSDVMYSEGCQWNQLEIPRFASVAEMLSQVNLDGAIIASPNHLHLENLREFDGQTIPLLIEKPLDTRMDQVAEVVRAASRYEGRILVDHVMRYAPIIRRAKSLIEEGRLGKVASFQFSQRMENCPFHTFRRNKISGGGQIIEKATHDLDVMLYLCNSLPSRVAMISKQQHAGGDRSNTLRCSECDDRLTCISADATHGSGVKDINQNSDLCVFAKDVDVSDNETCLIELENGTFGTYSHTYFCRMPGHSRIYEVIGTEGAMVLELTEKDSGYAGVLSFFPRTKEGETETFKYDYFNKIHYNGGPYVARHFYDLMCDPEMEPFTTVNQAFVAEALGFAAMRSADERQFVTVESSVPDDLKEVYHMTY